MSTTIRHLPPGFNLVEVTVTTVQRRFLLKPTPGFREIVVGALGRAQELYPVQVHALACLSNHLHLLLSPQDVQQLAAFMGHLNTNLSKEAGRLHDWKGPLFDRRYEAIVVSNEKKAQIARLRYILEQGCKENLVAKPSDWPGAHCATALVEGKPLAGLWFDRTAEYNARRCGTKVGAQDFATPYTLKLAPLPCWSHLTARTVRRYVAEMVSQIEEETRERHHLEATRPLGLRAIRKAHPHQRPRQSKKSPAPRFHAASQRVRDQLRQGYAAFVECFREASEKLRRGEPPAGFPAGCFPPGGPFKPPEPVPG